MTSPRTLLKAWNLHPKKQLGQNFLSDRSVAQMIADRSGISSYDVVLEIGAGLGALTIPIARKAEKIYAVDKDSSLLDLLKTELLTHKISNVVLMEADILKFDINALAEESGRKLVIMGNLPYNISSQVIVRLIHSRAAVSRAILMLQKEFARRLTAQSGCKDYSRLTVMLRYCSEIIPVSDVHAGLFFPKPKVDSQVIEIKFSDTPEHQPEDEAFFFKVIKAGFGQRRKTLKNALAGSELHIAPGTADRVLRDARIDPIRRAETLELHEFVRLSDTLAKL